MGSESEVDTSRVVVQTYLPAYQREEWDQHADELDMSRSEFVRTMVQAGRRGFGAETTREDAPADDASTDRSLEEQIVEQIGESGALSWNELVTELTDDIESRLESALGRLQDEGKVRHSGPAGGYVLEGNDE